MAAAAAPSDPQLERYLSLHGRWWTVSCQGAQGCIDHPPRYADAPRQCVANAEATNAPLRAYLACQNSVLSEALSCVERGESAAFDECEIAYDARVAECDIGHEQGMTAFEACGDWDYSIEG